MSLSHGRLEYTHFQGEREGWIKGKKRDQTHAIAYNICNETTTKKVLVIFLKILLDLK